MRARSCLRPRLLGTVLSMAGLSLVSSCGPRVDGGPDADAEPAVAPIRVPLWANPGKVGHASRFAWTWEDPAVLTPFRKAEGLDDVVAGAGSDEERARRLVTWARRQFEPGRPDPYPPPDAERMLAQIRGGITEGFCAQYCFLVVQALQAFGIPARNVTVKNHEVLEAWLRDERRWVMLDPLNELQVEDGARRSLSVLEIWQTLDAGRSPRLRGGELELQLDTDEATYLARFRRAGVWLHAAFTTRPVNFTDFRRYRAWYRPESGGLRVPEKELSTPHAMDLWSPPAARTEIR